MFVPSLCKWELFCVFLAHTKLESRPEQLNWKYLYVIFIDYTLDFVYTLEASLEIRSK